MLTTGAIPTTAGTLNKTGQNSLNRKYYHHRHEGRHKHAPNSHTRTRELSHKTRRSKKNEPPHNGVKHLTEQTLPKVPSRHRQNRKAQQASTNWSTRHTSPTNALVVYGIFVAFSCADCPGGDKTQPEFVCSPALQFLKYWHWQTLIGAVGDSSGKDPLIFSSHIYPYAAWNTC